MESTDTWRLKLIRNKGNKSSPSSFCSDATTYSAKSDKSKKDRKRKSRHKKQKHKCDSYEPYKKSTGTNCCNCLSNVFDLLKELCRIICGKSDLTSLTEILCRILDIICSLKTNCCNLIMCTCCKIYGQK